MNLGITQIAVEIMLTHPDAKVPTYAKDGDAGCDVRAVPGSSTMEEILSQSIGATLVDEKRVIVQPEAGDYILPPNSTVMVDLGLKIALKPGWEMQVRSRSGMAKRGLVVANSPGTIDSGYRGPCMVLLHNTTSMFRIIKPGTRVAQFVLKRAPQANFVLVDSLDETERGEGGFGSTGTK